MIQRSGNRPAA